MCYDFQSEFGAGKSTIGITEPHFQPQLYIILFSSSVDIMVLTLSIFSLCIKSWKYVINMWGGRDMLYTWRTNHHAYATDVKMSRGQEKQGPAGGSITQGVTYM